MSKTYKVTGINLKSQVFGEADRLVTVLTKEHGLIKAIAPGARKHHSSLGGRSGMFVVNELLIAKGRSLDKITQAQTIESYPGLAKDLGKLAASQYLAEIALCQALSEQPQEELFILLNQHLQRLQTIPPGNLNSIIAYLSHGIYQLLALAGFTPQVNQCCLSQVMIEVDTNNPHWQVGFSVNAGGIVCLSAWEAMKTAAKPEQTAQLPVISETRSTYPTTAVPSPNYEIVDHQQELPKITRRLKIPEFHLLQQLSQPEIMQDTATENAWLSIEQILRQYAQYHFGNIIRSATLIDSYFAANHDATV
ncbi:DNA repair protein RecO [Calothrix sp. 336/3]|uniref:DNA repair protein RecO n=1 Tax=Calothrix sp. 336/3 TaxID=1337936 RepID=UPI0004E2C843|nr:DNA repair protein RecO [Calothrix sp. 336/3]AKG24100.1 DNA repair protein RecO [Calothrix sp. 336/3]